MFDENADRDPIRLLETAAAELDAFGQPAAAAAVRETVRRITESLRLTPPPPGDAQAGPEVLMSVFGDCQGRMWQWCKALLGESDEGGSPLASALAVTLAGAA